MFKKASFKKPKITLELGGVSPAPANTEIPDAVTCPQCKKPVSKSVVEDRDHSCPGCGYYFKIPARKRVLSVCDSDSFEEWVFDVGRSEGRAFPNYAAKLKEAAQQSGESEAVISGFGRIQGNACAIFVMDFQFLMGSMGSAVGEKLALTFERARRESLPVIGYTLSGGARMQEGILSLMQMAKVSAAVRRHSDSGLLYIAVLTDPTAGGVTASFAMQADIIFAEPNALICFAGPRVIEQTIRQKLPEGFQRAEFLLEKGFVDRIVDRPSQRPLFAQLLKLHGRAAQ